MDLTTVYGASFGGGVVLLAAWILYPFAAPHIKSFFIAPDVVGGSHEIVYMVRKHVVTLFFAGGLVLLGFSLWILFSGIQKAPEPPDMVAVQQEFTRFQNAPLEQTLDVSWKAYSLSNSLGWVESGFDFSAGDYFWVFSFDSCHIKLQPFGGGQPALQKIGAAYFQTSVQNRVAVYFKVPVKNPSVFIETSQNVYVKKWSYTDAIGPQRNYVIFGLILLFPAALLLGAIADIQLARQKTEPASSGALQRQTQDASLSGVGLGSNPGETVDVLVGRIARDLNVAYATGSTVNIVRSQWGLLKDHNFRKQVEAKIKNIDELTKFRNSVRDFATSDLKDKKAFITLEADIAEEEVRKGKAEKEKGDLSGSGVKGELDRQKADHDAAVEHLKKSIEKLNHERQERIDLAELRSKREPDKSEYYGGILKRELEDIDIQIQGLRDQLHGLVG